MSAPAPFLLLAAIFALSLSGQQRYQPVKDSQFTPPIPYTRYFTEDGFGRRITFYVAGDPAKRLPLVVSILGSGAFSNFIQRNDRILDAHRTTRQVFDGRAHVVIVEKPGVEFLEQHPNRGTATEGSAEFRREHTLDRWAEPVSAALRAARSLPLADNRWCLVIGHSEGGIVASRVASINGFVTHVATLAGGGPTQLYDLIEAARDGRLYTAMPHDPGAQMSQLLNDAARVRADPEASEKFLLGHPYRRWSTFWASSTAEELSRTAARIFIAQGTADRNVSLTAFDMLYAQLLAHGKDVTARRIDGADHGFGFTNQPGRDGWNEIFEEIRNWFMPAAAQ